MKIGQKLWTQDDLAQESSLGSYP